MRITSLVIAAVPCTLGFLLTSGSWFMMGGQERTSQDGRNIAPGFAFRVVSASIATDGTISVRYKVADSAGLPLDVTGRSKPTGAIAVSHQAGYVAHGQTHFRSYTTTSSPEGRRISTLGVEDVGGSLTPLGSGEYIYTFGGQAPPGWDPTATHRIVVHGVRDMKPWNLGTKYAETVFDFVPAGGSPKPPEIHRHCNSCHGESQAAPDGSPRSEQICIMCHTQMKCAS